MAWYRKGSCNGCRKLRKVVILLAALTVALVLPAGAPAATFTWSATGSLAVARYNHTATLLPNGQVLVAGGFDGTTWASASAELYDPAMGTWSATGSMTGGRENHRATLLRNGQVLVTSGGSAELYEPATGSWYQTGSLATQRDLHTATLLPNGKVLVSGGFGFGGVTRGSAELYDPTQKTWSYTGVMTNGGYSHTATLLRNGQVLVVGGSLSSPGPRTGGGDMDGQVLLAEGSPAITNSETAIAQLYDPATGTWTATGSMATRRSKHTATLLANGKVLVAGGVNSQGYLTSCELYDPATGTWSATGSMATRRSGHTTILLANGKVLVAGGRFANPVPLIGPGDGIDGKVPIAGVPLAITDSVTSGAELYDPATGTWSKTASLATQRDCHTGTLLPNGQVLVAGGEYVYPVPLASGELYDSSPMGHFGTLLLLLQ